MLTAVRLTTFPDTYSLLLAFVLLVLLYIIGSISYNLFFSTIYGIPGPFLARISRLWLANQIWNGKLIYTLPNEHEKYGKFVRIAPDEVSIADAKAIRSVYAVGKGFVKTDFYDGLQPPLKTPLGGLFQQRDEKLHSKRQRIIAPIYTMANVLLSEKYIDMCTHKLLERFDVAAESKEIIDLTVWFQSFTADVIGELFYGRTFAFLDRVDQEKLWRQPGKRESMRWAMVVAVMPRLRSLAFLLSIFNPGVRGGTERHARLYSLAKHGIEEHQRSTSDRSDMLSQCFRLKEHHPEYTDQEIVMEAFDAIGAGSETTAFSLGTIMGYILKNPDAYRKLEDEIDQAQASGDLSSRIQYSETTRFQYLSAVCKEAFRMLPSIALPLPRLVPRGGAVISDHFFPEGTKVGLSAQVIHFDKNVFGDNAAEFKPERWFSTDAENMERHLLHFGAGSRMCLGKNISLVEIYKLMSELLRRYRFRPAGSAAAEWSTEGFWFNQHRNIHVFIERKS